MSANTEQTAAALGNPAPTRRRERVRRADDLPEGWARIVGEGLRLSEVES